MRKTLITILCYCSSHFVRDGGKPFSFFLTMLIFSLSSVNFVLASTYAVESRHQNVHFERTDTIPKGPNPVAEANCKLFTVTNPSESAKGIKDRGWAVTSEVHYGPFEIVSFAGSLESTYGPCIINNTNIAIFHKRKLIGFFYTDPNFDHQLASIRIDSSGSIKIFSGGGLNSLSYEIVFRDNRITLDTPIYKTACEGDGIIPTSNLNIFDKQQELKDFGWRPIANNPMSEKLKTYKLDPYYDKIRVEKNLPALNTCGGMYCEFLYETDKSYLDITTTSDNYRVLSYNGFCK